MSKELNIIEAVNMPVGTILKDGDLDTSNVLKVCCDESDGSKYFKVERDGIWIELNRLDNLWLNGKYVIYKKPVSFMEAIEAYKNGSDIKVKLNGTFRKYKRSDKALIDKDNQPINCYEILDGEWYIEED